MSLNYFPHGILFTCRIANENLSLLKGRHKEQVESLQKEISTLKERAEGD